MTDVNDAATAVDPAYGMSHEELALRRAHELERARRANAEWLARHRPVNNAFISHDVPVLGPIGRGTPVSQRARPVLGVDYRRHGVLFQNCSRATMRVFPDNAPLSAGAGGIVLAPWEILELFSSTGGELGEDAARVRLNCGWQAVADEPGMHPLTVWDWSDSVREWSGAHALAPRARLSYIVDLPEAVSAPDRDLPRQLQQWPQLSTRSRPILPIDRNRRGVLFANPGRARKAIAPGNIAAGFAGGSVVLAPGERKEFRAFGRVRVNAAFNACTDDASDGVLSVMIFL